MQTLKCLQSRNLLIFEWALSVKRANRSFKDIYKDYIKLRQKRFDYISGKTGILNISRIYDFTIVLDNWKADDRNVLMKLKAIYNQSKDKWDEYIDKISRHDVYVNTGECFECFNNNKSKIIKMDVDRQNTCPIWICDIENEEILFVTKWNHYFHAQCIETLIFYKNKCPLWRFKAF